MTADGKKMAMEKKYYVIGLGGYGSKLAEELGLKIKKDCSSVVSVAFDTDNCELQANGCDYKFNLSSMGNFDSVVSNLSKKKNIELFHNFDDIEFNYARSLHMNKGSSLWRMKAYVSFINFMCDDKNKRQLDSFIEEIAFKPNVESEFYFVGSLAGGTSSALALPLALYFKKLFKELNYRNYKTVFFASAPDVFAMQLNAELKSKAFANAYATLSEINTVNSIANRRGAKKFIIGGENLPFGELFNGENGEYNYRACAPFNDIVIFDRTPSINSVETFRLNVCSYIYYYFLGLVNLEKSNLFGDLGIYSSYCVSELDYSLENNVNYVSKYITNKKLCEEFNKAYTTFKNAEKGSYNDDLHKENVSETERFTSEVVKCLVNMRGGELDKASVLLNRGEEFDFGEDITYNDNEIKYYGLFRSYFFNLIKENEEYLELIEKLNKSYFTKDENNKIKFNKRNKKEKLNEFVDYYKELYDEIKDLFNNLIDNYFNNQEIEKLIFNNSDLSIEKVIKIDGKFIHPTLALVKLSHVYNILCQRQRVYLKLSEAEIYRSIIDKETPIKILKLKDFKIVKKGYGSLPATRLINTFDDVKIEQDEKINKHEKIINNKFEVKTPNKEEGYIISDLKIALENCIDLIFGIFISKITKSVELLINNYREFYENIYLISRKLNNDCTDLIFDDNSSNVLYHVRSNQFDRSKDVNNYLMENLSRDISVIDDGYGKILFKFARELKDENLIDVSNITEELFNCEKEYLKQSSFYLELEKKNVLSAMSEPNVKCYAKSLLKKACGVSPIFITENAPSEIHKRTLYVSKDVAEYVLSHKSEFLLRETSLVGAVEELLSSMGDFDTQVKIAENLSNCKLFVVSEKSGIDLQSISKINCKDGLALYETEYHNAIKNKTQYYSEMWNPHIFLLDGETELSNLK